MLFFSLKVITAKDSHSHFSNHGTKIEFWLLKVVRDTKIVTFLIVIKYLFPTMTIIIVHREALSANTFISTESILTTCILISASFVMHWTLVDFFHNNRFFLYFFYYKKWKLNLKIIYLYIHYLSFWSHPGIYIWMNLSYFDKTYSIHNYQLRVDIHRYLD